MINRSLKWILCKTIFVTTVVPFVINPAFAESRVDPTHSLPSEVRDGNLQFKVDEYQTEPSSHVIHFNPVGKTYEAQSVTYRVIIPPDYPNCPTSEPCYGVIYFLHGRGSNSKMLEDLGVLDVLKSRVFSYTNRSVRFLIVSPSGDDHYWVNQPQSTIEDSQTRNDWGTFVALDLVADVEKRFIHVKSHPDFRILAGISMGGHGALQISMNFPNRFSNIAAHSPVLRTFEESRSLADRFGNKEEYGKRDPFSIFESWPLNQPPFFKHLWFDIGRGDWAYKRSQEFANSIIQRYPEADVKLDDSYPDGHDFQYWRKRLYDYILWYQRSLPF